MRPKRIGLGRIHVWHWHKDKEHDTDLGYRPTKSTHSESVTKFVDQFHRRINTSHDQQVAWIKDPITKVCRQRCPIGQSCKTTPDHYDCPKEKPDWTKDKMGERRDRFGFENPRRVPKRNLLRHRRFKKPRNPFTRFLCLAFGQLYRARS